MKFIIPLDGKIINLYTKSQLLIANSYTRIVIGKRGPYVEFDSIFLENTTIPKLEQYRINSNMVYYIEYRTILDNVKIYYQQKTVAYADYKIGKYYISPQDLYIENNISVIYNKNILVNELFS